MRDRPVTPVENFTRPFLVTGFLALFTLLVLVWALWGYGWALAVGAGLAGLVGLCRR
ncbi:hypothetical protein [Rhodovulum euryhalinum]|uniref:Uncharacterized protein n=1 Tax=Rhodovulum euryhalinum TaxID=35805 RepID=A0A4R2KBL5_9RHOB|nr:hypothetical protein [Rhodovulum euryhalinum]TCO70881.1 hypothetical protein EV655_108122 [Rhodovulum euryhalinum]